MAKPHERVFALVAAAMFLTTTVAFSGAVIWQIRKDNESKDKQNTAETEQSDNQTNTCEFDTPAAPKEADAEVFKPTGDVTQLQVTDLTVGTGQVVKSGDCLIVKYNGTLVDGTKFDGDFDKDTGLQFQVGQGNVIAGWDQGLAGMKEGGVRRLVIPSELAYKDQGAGTIPPNADLVFVVKLVKIKQ